jgi:hypothetical protein
MMNGNLKRKRQSVRIVEQTCRNPGPLVKIQAMGREPSSPPNSHRTESFNYSFVDSPAGILANDLETYTKREGIKKLDRSQ